MTSHGDADHSTLNFIRQNFLAYYSGQADFRIPFFRMREFGFIPFNGTGMTRHIYFASPDHLHNFLKMTQPAHVYYSSAMYRGKSHTWDGADLVFDIDADHLKTSCKPTHDKWRCQKCGAVGVGGSPGLCPVCKSYDIKGQVWVCRSCLEQARREVIKLVSNFLEPDFGIDPDRVSLAFSGHRGYHVKVSAPEFRKMSSDARREIGDYVTGRGFDPTRFGLFKTDAYGRVLGPSVTDFGWGGKFVWGLLKWIDSAPSGAVARVLGPSRAAFVLTNKSHVREQLTKDKPDYSLFRGMTDKQVSLLIDEVKEYIAAHIDHAVTSDARRLIRLPNSLHGKTGLRAVPLRWRDLESFDPTHHAFVFGDEPVTVEFTEDVPALQYKGVSYGAYPDGAIESLSKSLAVYVICRGAAKLSVVT